MLTATSSLSDLRRVVCRGVYRTICMGSAVSVALLGLSGCSALDVNNPSRITGDNITNSVGAEYAVRGMRRYYAEALGISVTKSGLLTDELFVDSEELPGSLRENPALDRREGAEFENILKTASSGSTDVGLYSKWQTTWRYAAIALPLVRQTGASDVQQGMLAELFARRGFILISLAEQICPGFPIRDVDANDLDEIRPVYTSAPQTADSAFTRAIVEFDSSLAHVGDSVNARNLARVGKARALLGLGRFADAAAVAATVDAGFVATMIMPVSGSIYSQFRSDNSVSVANREGNTGVDFVTAADPRISLTATKHAVFGDTTVFLYAPTPYYTNRNAAVVTGSDIEARLIQAEAQLQPAGNPSGPWLATLNALRATVALPDTTDPGTAAGRVNLLFRERAFWLFGTAHRLGDLRRLIAYYGRDAESVFPTGHYRLGGNYSTATSIPFDGAFEHRFNPAITGCTTR